ncbi:MAG: cyclase family protein [Prolixibacteraceae bacterium]|nr:cyclase family protein [Prolixibacteraceae bacterium]
MKNTLLILAFLLTLSCSFKENKSEKAELLSDLLQSATWVDLTYSFDENSVYWPTNVPYTHDTVFYGINDQGYFYSSFKFSAEEHGGTHFDAPIHFGENQNTIEKVPLKQLKGPGVVVNVSEKAMNNPDYLFTVDDFMVWEEKHGLIPEGAIILVYSGHGKYYYDKEKYLGTNLTGPEAVPELHFPGLSPEAALWLCEERNINAIGLDTPSIDYGQSTDFMAHRILCAHGKTIYENVANLDQLPEEGTFIIALPMKIKGGSGSPLRIVAVI